MNKKVDKMVKTRKLTNPPIECDVDFIPKDLEVSNIGSLFTGLRRNLAVDRFHAAWDSAENFAFDAGIFIHTLRIVPHNYGRVQEGSKHMSRGAPCFRGTRLENDSEWTHRIWDIVNNEQRKIQDNALAKRNARLQLEKAQAKVAELEKKI